MPAKETSKTLHLSGGTCRIRTSDLMRVKHSKSISINLILHDFSLLSISLRRYLWLNIVIYCFFDGKSGGKFFEDVLS